MNDNPICDACGKTAPSTSIIGMARVCETCRPAVMAEIDALREEGKAVDAYKIVLAMRPPEQVREDTPTPEAIRAFLKRHNISGAQAARMAYLSGGQAVRKYTGGAKPHRMSGAVWFCLHAHTVLSKDEIVRIETAMVSSSNLNGG